ncbi:IS110 family transposase [Breznakia pachnodae]|uniref:Transposase n=1 Tax=Breznakia pachnodae TaxID=265178 RepID=A0ABU0E7K3_9FIRM|nr:IS110 family transposase [Breznakia pachnodae]MDQ0362465.1 transposase [Breznakia pachnodae]
MKDVCITVDVSKNESHVGSYLDLNTPFKAIFKVKHDLQGFKKIKELANEMKRITSKNVHVVFEATGIYHRGLQNYLENENFIYFMVNPILSSRYRKQNLRNLKTDKQDCKNIAKLYFCEELIEERRAEDIYYTLRQYSRNYESLLVHLRKCKVNFNEELDVVFPGYKKLFSNLYGETSMIVLKKYKHPEIISNTKETTMCKYLQKHTNHQEKWLMKKCKEIKEFSDNTVSGCRKDDVNVKILLSLIDQIEYYELLVEEILNKMIHLAKKTENMVLLTSIPGIGDNLAARIIAEIGDINRFTESKQLIAFAGIEPMIYQSGKNNGLHYKISKKGNKRLRCLLYLAVKCIVRKAIEDTTIREFYQKKMTQENPMNRKAAIIASANKLLRVIYGMCKTGCLYQ